MRINDVKFLRGEPRIDTRPSPVIAAEDVCFSFGSGDLRKQILFDINLQIYPGEVVLLTGPSGSGKTTLLTLIAALRSMQQGELTVLGCKLQGASSSQLVQLRRSIGFIFQQHNLLGFLTARRNVELMFQLHPEIPVADARARSIQILQQVGLGERINYFPASLSGGQKQRIAIARALVCKPKLILADEPTAALDSQSGRDVVNLLVKLARETGSPVLMVTHDARVLDIADRIVSFEDGRIVNSAQH
ncbi:MAG: ATP-binding cassette domain-containing protein [Pirellulaceae bacterium]|nr:ATP-binding cassette domain-containing protein [Pirellulaceae bacterium]